MAVLNQGIQRFQGFFHRRGRVKTTDLVKVNIIGLQALQTGLALVHDVHPGGTAGIRACAHRAEHLGGYHDVFALDAQIFQRLANNALTGATAVDIGGVNEVDARVQRHRHQLVGLPPALVFYNIALRKISTTLILFIFLAPGQSLI